MPKSVNYIHVSTYFMILWKVGIIVFSYLVYWCYLWLLVFLFFPISIPGHSEVDFSACRRRWGWLFLHDQRRGAERCGSDFRHACASWNSLRNSGNKARCFVCSSRYSQSINKRQRWTCCHASHDQGSYCCHCVYHHKSTTTHITRDWPTGEPGWFRIV